MRLAAAAGGGDMPALPDSGMDPALDPTFAPGMDPAADPDGPHLARPLLIGGALTSAALSLAGAAYVAWRRSHPPVPPMTRAVRAVAQARLTQGGRPRGLA
jgi:hypothetical protein